MAPLYEWAIKIPLVRNKFLAKDLSAQDLEAKCRIFKKILLGKESHHETRKGVIDLVKVTTFMVRNHVDTAPVLTMLYRLVVAAGYVSTLRLSIFIPKTRVDAPQRQTDLTYLHFERRL